MSSVTFPVADEFGGRFRKLSLSHSSPSPVVLLRVIFPAASTK
jgi:hypothetical protein